MQDPHRAIPDVEDAMNEVLERMRLSPILSGGRDFRQVLLDRSYEKALRLQVPPLLPNWTVGLDWDAARRIALDEGIPLAYVPPVDVVTALMNAASAADRLLIIESERDAIADACLVILQEGPLVSAFPEFSPLARATVKAIKDGHFQAAQALAVNVIESFVREWVAEKYKTVKQYALDADPALADPNAPFNAQQVRLETIILPLFKFYADWFSHSGDPAPTELSRHVTVHQATPAHYTMINAVLAVMLMTSLLKGCTEAIA